MQENDSQYAKNTIKELKKSLNVKTDTQLSEILGIKPNTISSWKKRNTMDYAKVIDKCNELGIDLNALFLNNPNKKGVSDSSKNTPVISSDLLYQYTGGNLKENVTKLPFMKFPFLLDKESIAFQIDNHQIENKTIKNTFAICEKINITDVNDDDTVIVVSKKTGFFITKIKASASETGIYILIPENKSVFDNQISISINDIDEIWKIKGMLNIL
jgi:CI repressor-like protein